MRRAFSHERGGSPTRSTYSFHSVPISCGRWQSRKNTTMRMSIRVILCCSRATLLSTRRNEEAIRAALLLEASVWVAILPEFPAATTTEFGVGDIRGCIAGVSWSRPDILRSANGLSLSVEPFRVLVGVLVGPCNSGLAISPLSSLSKLFVPPALVPLFPSIEVPFFCRFEFTTIVALVGDDLWCSWRSKHTCACAILLRRRL